MMEKLIAYHGNESKKTAILAQLQAHHDADEIVKGKYWQDGKGCAVGCTIHSSEHRQYEPLFGIPQMLARLEDCIFEGLPNDKAKGWPIRFMSAIKVGSELSLVGWKFLYILLSDEKINPSISHPVVRDAVAQAAEVICAISKGEPFNERAASAAEWAAESAAESAAERAASAAESAAEWAAEWAAAWAAAWAAEWAAYEKMADVLIQLLEAA